MIAFIEAVVGGAGQGIVLANVLPAKISYRRGVEEKSGRFPSSVTGYSFRLSTQFSARLNASFI